MAKGSKKRKRDLAEEPRLASGTMSKKRKTASAEGSKAEEQAAKWARTQLELSKAVNSVVMVLADTLLDETLENEQKVSTFSRKVTPTAAPGLTSLKLKCNKCEVEQFYALRKPLVGPNENHTTRRVREAPFGLKDLKPQIQGLGVICPDCTVKAVKAVRRWPDGYPRVPPEMNTEGQFVKGMKTMIELLFNDKTLSNAMQPLLTNSTPVDKSKMQEATPEQNDTMQMFAKTVKAMSDERMREDDGLCRDPIKNKQMVADCTRVLVPCPYIPETDDRSPRDPGSHDYESLRAGVQSVKNRPVEIYFRDESSFWGMLNFTFGGRALPNHSVPPNEEYLSLATRHKTSQSPLTENRKVLLEGSNVKDGCIKAVTVQIPYHYPMAPVEGGVVPECQQYVKQYAGAVKRYQMAYAELGDKSLAIKQMRREVQNEAACDLEVALWRCLDVDSLSCGSIAEASSQEASPASSLNSTGEASGSSSTTDGSMGAIAIGSDISITSDSDSEIAPGPAKHQALEQKSCELVGDPNLGQTQGFKISPVTTSPDTSAANEVQNVDEQTQNLAGTNHKDMRPTMLGSTGLTSMLKACTTKKKEPANAMMDSIGETGCD
ncbi:hypothetical protein PRZ48_002429 [Zasmidium cellare]|uniref:Uncharacterized protein n=1 Tax=Zasmidium cellare TaxID=395010 RepID=A0ABR0F5Y9_ZASCE|nr:hypothetical protein PRZ48_002429 [Zasmidium cellare]